MTLYITKDCSHYGLKIGDIFEGVEPLVLSTDNTKTIPSYLAVALQLQGYGTTNLSDMDVHGMKHAEGREYSNKANVFKNGYCWQLKPEFRVSSTTWVESEWENLTEALV